MKFKRFIKFLNTPLKKSLTNKILDVIGFIFILFGIISAYIIARESLLIMYDYEMVKTLLMCMTLISISTIGGFILLVYMIRTEKKELQNKEV